MTCAVVRPIPRYRSHQPISWGLAQPLSARMADVAHRVCQTVCPAYPSIRLIRSPQAAPLSESDLRPTCVNPQGLYHSSDGMSLETVNLTKNWDKHDLSKFLEKIHGSRTHDLANTLEKINHCTYYASIIYAVIFTFYTTGPVRFLLLDTDISL